MIRKTTITLVLGISLVIFMLLATMIAEKVYADEIFDQDALTSLEKIKQFNEEGNNYIVVETTQKNTLETIVDYADKLLFPEMYEQDKYYDRGYTQPYPKHYDNNNGRDLELTVRLIDERGIHNMPDFRVVADGKQKIIHGEEFRDDGKAKVKFFFEYVPVSRMNVCIEPINYRTDLAKCKTVDTNGDETVTFHLG